MSGGIRRNLFNVHSTVWTDQNDRTTRSSVQRYCDIILVFDVLSLFDEHGTDNSSLRSCLTGNQNIAKQPFRVSPRRFRPVGGQDAARFAAPTRMDLSLDHQGTSTQLRRLLDDLFRCPRHSSDRNRNTEGAEQLFCLIFMNIHVNSFHLLSGGRSDFPAIAYKLFAEMQCPEIIFMKGRRETLGKALFQRGEPHHTSQCGESPKRTDVKCLYTT